MGTAHLVAEFVGSTYQSGHYAHWPLDRQLVAFLANGRNTTWVLGDDAAYKTLYDDILTGQRQLLSGGEPLRQPAPLHQISRFTGPRHDGYDAVDERHVRAEYGRPSR
ncbi:hypothetical protein [Antrihabitans cavernicola]|uniref:Uncharacterized protein n=1 Tax=Antrihabitans cavernicola TaxID=2495913 RepID=A0A5A7S169_9NOCA|nr:hypothetical protein [Spelaeibacter cavernicola]KAA0016549.1 hypothetical protein FOY51_25990 [Spelaeibacter cavernicola]